MLKLLTVSAVCLGTSLAQVQQTPNCISSENRAFGACLVDFALDVDIFWDHNGDDVDFLFESPDSGWRSVGFSSGAAGFSMFPSNVVVGCVDGSPPVDYEIFGGRVQGVGPETGNQNLEDLVERRLDGMCIVEFTRPVDAQLNISRGIPELQVLNNQFVRTIVAGGNDGILGQHASDMRTRFSVNYLQGIGAASTLSSSVTIAVAIVCAVVVSLFQ